MTAKCVVGWALITSPIWLVIAGGLIFDFRDAAPAFGLVFGLVGLMALGFWLLEER